MNRHEPKTTDHLDRMRIARDESEALLREVYRALCGTPTFQREHPNLDNRVRAHLLGRSRFIEEQQRPRRMVIPRT